MLLFSDLIFFMIQLIIMSMSDPGIAEVDAEMLFLAGDDLLK